VLVDFVKAASAEGPARAAALLQRSLSRFPGNSFEQRYLEFLLRRYREEKRI
jgi:hypothetical protein